VENNDLYARCLTLFNYNKNVMFVCFLKGYPFVERDSSNQKAILSNFAESFTHFWIDCFCCEFL